MTKRDKIFVNGMTSFDVPDTTPDFILGKGSFKVDDLINFLNDHKDYAIDGYLNYTILRSKTSGKRYVELDMWKYDQKQEESLSPEAKETLAKLREQERVAKNKPLEEQLDEPPF
jgi:hypothetical protein